MTERRLPYGIGNMISKTIYSKLYIVFDDIQGNTNIQSVQDRYAVRVNPQLVRLFLTVNYNLCIV